MPFPFSYSAFGLALRSSHAVPGLAAVEDASTPDVVIRMNSGAAARCRLDTAEVWYPAAGQVEHADGLRAWRLDGGRFFRLQYADGTEFVVDRFGTEISVTWPDSSTLEDTSIYLLGPVLGFVLRLRGITCLHASAVQIGGVAVALLGAGEAGKSTTAAAFAQMGFPVLTDDVAPLLDRSGVPYLQPAYPQLRLWPDSVEMLYGSQDALPPLTPTWTKRALDLGARGYSFQREPLPLAAIYVLGERSDSGPRIDALGGHSAIKALLAHSYVGYLLDRTMREQEFESLTRAGSRIAIRRVVSAQGTSHVFRLCAHILEDCEAMGCTASPITVR